MRSIVAFATDVRKVPFNRVTTLPAGQTSDLLKIQGLQFTQTDRERARHAGRILVSGGSSNANPGHCVSFFLHTFATSCSMDFSSETRMFAAELKRAPRLLSSC